MDASCYQTAKEQEDQKVLLGLWLRLTERGKSILIEETLLKGKPCTLAWFYGKKQ